MMAMRALLIFVALVEHARTFVVVPTARATLHRTRAGSVMASEKDLLTLAEVEDAARRVGCEITTRATGPKFRVELLWEGGKALPAPQVQTLGYNDEAPPPPELLGYCDGFTQPTGVTHLEAIEIRKYTGFWARKKERGAARYEATKPLNPGLLVSLATACWIREEGPFTNAKAQLLCINDDARQHRSLVRFYRRLGFRKLREVGPGLQSVPDKIVWGGEGTMMEIDIDQMRQPRGIAAIVRGMGARGSDD